MLEGMRTVRRSAGVGLLALALACALTLSLAHAALPAFGQTDEQTVRVGVYENEPKVYTGENGQPAGIFIDLIEAIADEEGWTLEYVSGTWEQGLANLSSGTIDIMPDVGYSAERERVYDFHTTPVAESWSCVYAAPGTDIELMAELEGKRIAVLSGSVQQMAFARIAEGFGVQIELVPTDSLKEAFQLAADGGADAAIANHLFGDYFYREYGLAKTPVVFNPTGVYFATAEGRNSDLLLAVDRHLDGWIDEPDSPYYQAFEAHAGYQRKPAVPEWVWWALGITAAVLLLAFGVIALLRWQVGRKTAELRTANDALRRASEDAQRNNELLESLVGVMRMPVTNQREFLDHALDEALRLTRSRYGYIALYDGETRTIDIASWSHDVMAECAVDHAPGGICLDDVGTWGEPIRQRQPVVVNDFSAADATTHGFPDGHVRLNRYLTVPIFDDERIVAVVGIANKETDYTADVDAIQLMAFMGGVWKELARVRADARRLELEEIASRGPAVAFTWSLEPGWPILFVSRNVDQFGYSAEDLVRDRTPFREFVHPDDLEYVARATEEWLARPGQELDIEYRILTADGETRWVYDASWMVEHQEDGPRINQGILVDITDRREAELELERSRDHLEECVAERTQDLADTNARLDSSNEALSTANAELEQTLEELRAANQRLEEATTAKSRFLATMSHELRTPLNSIIGFSDLLGRGMAGPLTDEEELQIGIINKSGRQLLGLINDILDLSKVEAGSMKLRLTDTDLVELVTEVVGALRPLAAEKALELSAALPGGPLIVHSDAERVRQIVTNIVGNAVKFTDAGSVSVLVETASDGSARIVVTDTGPGIAVEDLPHIFNAFRQAERAKGDYPTGTGLGLAISRELTTLLGGTVTATSTLGEGSTFEVTLPLRCP